MILNRRDFVRASLGWAAAAGTFCLPGHGTRSLAQADSANGSVDDVQRWMATSNQVRCLGRPRSLLVVRQGFWPISPERVLVLRPHPWAGPTNRWQHGQARSPLFLRNELRQRAKESDWQGRANKNWAQISDHKLGLIARITSALANYYAVPELRDEWAYEMAAREGLGTTYVGSNVAQPHQFQTDRLGRLGGRAIQTDNDGIDHWLVLIPGGTNDWEGWREDTPVHVMTTHIFPQPWPGRNSGLTAAACMLAGRGVFGLAGRLERWYFSSPELIELSRVDRATAARRVDEQIILVARQEEEEWKRRREAKGSES